VHEHQHVLFCSFQVEKLYVVKIGEVVLEHNGQPVSDPSFVRESGGFTFFGDAALTEPFRSRYTVKVCWGWSYLPDTGVLLSLLCNRVCASFLWRANTLEFIATPDKGHIPKPRMLQQQHTP
jgi:hypothetical protein